MAEENKQPEKGQVASSDTPVVSQSTTQIDDAQKKKNKKIIIIVVAVVGALTVLGIIGTLVSGLIIKNIFEKGIETVTDGKVDIDMGRDGGSIKIKGESGEEMRTDSGSSVKLPAEFPSYVPIYSKSKLETASTYTDEDGKKTFSVGYKSSDSAEKIFAFFEKELTPENGFKVNSSSVNSSGFSIISATYEADGSTMTISVVNGSDDESRSIQYIVREKSE